jgi:hypothetical protein
VTEQREGLPRRYDAVLAAGGAFAGIRQLLAYLPFLGFAIAFATLALGLGERSLTIIYLSLILIIARVLFARFPWPTGRTTRVTASVEGGALLLQGKERCRVLPLSSVRSGMVLSQRSSALARLALRGRWGQRTIVHLSNVDDARSLLGDMKLSARDRPARFAFFFGLRVTVGADGVLMEWPLLRRRRFVPYSKIVALSHEPGKLLFRLADGKRYEIMTTTSGRAIVLEHHAALVERVEDALAAYRARTEEPPLASLQRGGRSALGWVKDLRALAETSGGGYRAATLPSDELWSVALDPAASEELRIGAGLALRPGLDEAGKARLRAAAAASASPRIRVVLEAAADEPDDDSLSHTITDVAPRRRATTR